MPTYEYACRNCGHEFELFQQMTDPVKRKCPKCGKLSLERLIGTGAGIIFKGSGFYETDYRSESYRKAARAETAAADGSGNGSKSDAKKDGVKSSSEEQSSAAGSGNAKKAETKPAASA